MPRPFPDISQAQSFHYCKFNETSNETEGKPRSIDDYQPRVQLKNLFNKGLISSNNQPAIQEFSRKFVTEEKLVIEYVKHLGELNFEKTKKAERKQKQISKESENSYSDYNWRELFVSNKLRPRPGSY